MSDVLGDSEKTILKIMQATGKSETEVKSLVSEKVKEFGGILSEAGAAFSVAKDLNVEVGTPTVRNKSAKLGELSEGVENVDVLCRVSRVFAPKAFESKGRSGKVASVMIADETGEARLTLWNRDCALVENEELKPGTTVLLRSINAGSYNGQKQLSLSRGGTVEIEPTGLDTSKLPSFKQEINTISSLKDGMTASVAGRITGIAEVRSFQQKNGGAGKVCNITVRDETGEIRVALWNEKVQAVEKMTGGDLVMIGNAAVKKGYQDKLELSVGSQGMLVIKPSLDEGKKRVLESILVKSGVVKQVYELSEGDQPDVLASIVNVFNVRTFDSCKECSSKFSDGKCTSCASTQFNKKELVNFEVDDGTGVLRCTAFTPLAEKIVGLDAIKAGEDSDKALRYAKESIGKEYLFSGRVKRDLTGRINFTCSKALNPNYGQQAQAILAR